MKTSNVVLALLGVSAAVFIAAMAVIFCIKDAVPDTLIQYTLGAGGVEALLLAGIKISKIRGTPHKPGEADLAEKGGTQKQAEFPSEAETELTGLDSDAAGEQARQKGGTI